MLCISQSRGLHLFLRPEQSIWSGKGELMYKLPPIRVRFRWKNGAALPAWAYEQALERISDWGALPFELKPGDVVGVLDTDAEAKEQGWNEEKKAYIEQRLLEMESGGSFIIAVKPPAQLPYPTYLKHRRIQGRRTLEHALAEIRTAIETVGIDPQDVLAYEEDNPDELTPAIQNLMLELLTEPQPELDEQVVTA